MDKLEISLHNWRSYRSQKIYLPTRSFSLIDNNGSGKTSLISAFYSLLTSKAWPGTSFNQHLATEQSYFGVGTNLSDWFLNGQIRPSGRLGTIYQKPEHIIAFDNLQLDPQSWPIIQTYTPTDNLWLSQTRTTKLQRLDQLIASSSNSGFEKSVKTLHKLVKEKQAMIKREQDYPNTADPILVKTVTEQIASISQLIWAQRLGFFNFMDQNFDLFRDWVATSIPAIKIRWSLTISGATKQSLLLNGQEMDLNHTLDWQSLWQKEVIVGRVLYGAHRDDFMIESDHRDVVGIFSRGEMRLFVLFLFSLSKDNWHDQRPTWWLLDDVFNELDTEREKIIYQEILNKSQFFMATGTKPPHLPTDIYSLTELVN
jgi:recombinational DNA repair ATPase RecF